MAMKKIIDWVEKHALILLVGGIATLGIVAQLTGSLITTYNTMVSPGGVPTMTDRATIMGLVFLVGLLLGRMRYKRRQLYGVLQILLGLVAAWSLTKRGAIADPITNMVALLGATYLIGRGFHDEGEDLWKRIDEEKKYFGKVATPEEEFAEKLSQVGSDIKLTPLQEMRLQDYLRKFILEEFRKKQDEADLVKAKQDLEELRKIAEKVSGMPIKKLE